MVSAWQVLSQVVKSPFSSFVSRISPLGGGGGERLALWSYALKKTINEFKCHEAKWSKVKRPGVEPRTPLD